MDSRVMMRSGVRRSRVINETWVRGWWVIGSWVRGPWVRGAVQSGVMRARVTSARVIISGFMSSGIVSTGVMRSGIMRSRVISPPLTVLGIGVKKWSRSGFFLEVNYRFACVSYSVHRSRLTSPSRRVRVTRDIRQTYIFSRRTSTRSCSLPIRHGPSISVMTFVFAR